MRSPASAVEDRGTAPVVRVRSGHDMQQDEGNECGDHIDQVIGVDIEGLTLSVDEREGGMVANQENGGGDAHDDKRPEDGFLADKGPAFAEVEDALDYAHCAGLSLVLSLISVPALLLAIPFAPAMGVRVPASVELVSMAALYGFLWVAVTRWPSIPEGAAGPLSCDTVKTLLIWRAVILFGALAVAGWTSGESSAAVFPLMTIGAWLGALVEGAGVAAVARLNDMPMSMAAATTLKLLFPCARKRRAAASGEPE